MQKTFWIKGCIRETVSTEKRTNTFYFIWTRVLETAEADYFYLNTSVSYLDYKRQSWFKVLSSCLVFNPKRRFDKVNSVIDCALFFPRGFLNHISLDLKTPSIREPWKARNFLDFINSNNEIGFSILQLKKKNWSQCKTNLYFYFIGLSPICKHWRTIILKLQKTNNLQITKKPNIATWPNITLQIAW